MMKKINFSHKELDNNQGSGGVEIRVDGYKNNPQCPDEAQIFIEIYEGKLRVHVWNGKQEPHSILIDPLEEFKIQVTQLVPDKELDADDLKYEPSGIHIIKANNEEDALDTFHETVPISVLEHFSVEVLKNET